MNNIIPWTEIESFHNIRKYTQAHPEILNDYSLVLYRPKVKLHGTNAGVQVHANGHIVAQSRATILTDNADNAGFAKWVSSNKDKWAQIALDTNEGFVIFGEWCGPGVQKGVAISEIPKKSFVVFAARPLNADSKLLIVEPGALQNLVQGIPDTYVLPWHTNPISIDWSSSAEDLTKSVTLINDLVVEVEATDPWVESTFGVKGTGEGLVYYPISPIHSSLKDFNNLVFKAKGEKHKNIKGAAPAQVNPEIATSIDQFVDMVLTAARLEQGAMAVMDEPVVAMLSFDMKRIGKFITWITNDVKKETQDELAASNLTWDQVNKSISNKARAWYLEKTKEI